LKVLLPLSIALAGFGLYSFTSYPAPDWLDSPEFIQAAYRFGIFHPPGSPLAILIGHLFSWCPFLTPAKSLLLFSAFFAAACLFQLANIIGDILQKLGPSSIKVQRLAQLLLCIIFGLTPGLWSQALRSEVYTLALFLFLMSLRPILLLLLGAEKPKEHRLVSKSLLYCGLGCCVHPLMALSILPAYLIIFISKINDGQFVRHVFRYGLFFTIGFLPFLLLPFMVHDWIDFRWSDPQTFSGWLEIISGSTFGHSFSGFQSTTSGHSLKTLVVIVAGLRIPLACLGVLGLYLIGRKNPKLALALFLGVVFSCLTLALQKSIRLDNPDVTGYALPAIVFVFLLAVYGLAIGVRLLESKIKPAVVIGLLCLLPLTQVGLLGEAGLFNRSECRTGKALAEKSLNQLPQNSIALVADFNLLFMFDYLIQVEKMRPDVTVLWLRDLDNQELRSALAQRQPQLEKHLPKSALEIDLVALRRLAEYRSLALDLGPHLAKLKIRLQPAGLLYLFSNQVPGEDSLIAFQNAFFKYNNPPRCSDNKFIDQRTADVIAWHSYWQAIWAHNQGLNKLAKTMISIAQAASPDDQTIVAAKKSIQ
jgi:hypothetical protein